MPPVPTSKPLTVKEFDRAFCGVCGGCSSACGYIAYLKKDTLVDLYGHPCDPNGIGSFCTKGIAYIQELSANPLRICKPILREGNNYRQISYDEVIGILKDLPKGKVAVFLDRFAGLEEYLIVKEFTDEVYSDSVYLPFKQTSVRAQEWVNKKAILIFEAEPTFSEVMLTRWIVDAFEKDAYIFSVGSRYTTVFQKSKENILTTPYKTVEILEAIAEGKYDARITKFLEYFGRETVVIVGDTLLKSQFKNRVLKAVKTLRERFGTDYSFVGNITPFPVKSLEKFIENLEDFEYILTFGNPFIYLSEEKLEKIKSKMVINFAYFPTITANHSRLVIPRTTFAEREFIVKGFGFLSYSPKILETKIPQPYELLVKATGLKYNLETFLKNFGVSLKEIKEKEGGVDLKMKDILYMTFEDDTEEEKGEVWILCDNSLVEELGHWNLWTHAIERNQFAYINESTKEKLGIGETVKINSAELRVKINNNIADNVIFIPNAFEEFQPFEPGIRVGRILRKPFWRFEALYFPQKI